MNEQTLHCPQCDYNLTGLTENRCPECGLGFDPEALAADMETWPEPISWPAAVFLLALSPALVGACAFFMVLSGWGRLYKPMGLLWALGFLLSYSVAGRLLRTFRRHPGSAADDRLREALKIILTGVFFSMQSLASYALLTVSRLI